jgi:hypothetical protein
MSRPRVWRPTSTHARTGAGSGGDRRSARFLRLMPRLQWRRGERQAQIRRSLGKPYRRERYIRRKDTRCTAACGETSTAVAPVLCRCALMVARGVGRADDGRWVEAERTRRRESPNHSLQRDRVGRNQRRGFADQPRHGAILPPAPGPRPDQASIADLCRMAITRAREETSIVRSLGKCQHHRRNERTGRDRGCIGQRLVVGHLHQHGQADPQQVGAVKAEDQQEAQARHEEKNAGEP